MDKLVVRVKTRQSSSEIVGFDADGVLLLKVKAPPEGGRANASVIELVARALHLPKTSIRIASGAGSTRKILLVPEGSALTFGRDRVPGH